ncbi:MAG: TRAP transporter small permease subunit [Helicobacter sp.]|nr:TRAP transporter small permease subunit [Helicobacter sp.]
MKNEQRNRRDPLLHGAHVLDGFTNFAGLLSASLFVVLILLVLYHIGLRLCGLSSIALFELQWHVFATGFLLAIPYTLQHDKHVRLDVLCQHYSPKQMHCLKIVSNLCFVMPFSLLILHYGSDFVMMSYQQNEVSDSGGLTHRYLIKAVPLLAFCLLFMQAYSEILKSIAFLKNDSKTHSDKQNKESQ